MAEIVLVGARPDKTLLGLAARFLRGAPVAPCRAQRRQIAGVIAEGVESLAMGRGIEQAALGELSFDLHQQLAELAQQAHARRLVVDEGAAAAVRGEHAAQHQRFLAGAVQALLGQELARWVIGRQHELRRHHRLLGALPHQPALGAHAQRQAQGVQQDRLAGAGLAGQYAEARPEPQFQAVDQHHIADGQACEHRTEGCEAHRIAGDDSDGARRGPARRPA